MLFSLGNLLTIAIVVVILLVYRQIDVNNRSLDKMRKYFGKIKEELDAIVEEKAMGLKDLSIELEVHEKTVKEVYNRIDQRSAELAQREEEVEKIHQQLDNYDAVLKELADMTSRVDENLKKLHEESIFVDGIGKVLKESAVSIEKLERRIPAISEDFNRKNSEAMELLKIGVFNDIELKANTIKDRIEDNRKNLEDFKDYISELEKRRDSLGDEVINTIRRELDDLAEEFQGNMSKSEDEFRSRLFETDEQGKTLSEEVFARIKSEITDKSNDINSDIEGNLALLENRIKEQFDRISAEMVQFEKTIQKKYVETQENSLKNYEASLEKIRTFEESMAGKNGQISEMRKEIGLISDDFNKRLESWNKFISELDDKRNFIVSDFSKKLEADVASFILKFKNKADEIEEKYIAKLNMSEQEGENYQDKVFDDIKKQILRNAETVKIDLLKQIEEVDSRVIANLSRLEGGITEYESSLNYRIEGIEGFSKDIELMEKNLKSMIDKVSERMRDDFHTFEVSLDAEKSEQKVKLDRDFSEIREVLETLENRIDELKKKSYENVTEKLQVFEDDFFKDLKVRNESINRELETWQQGITAKIEKISAEKLGMREEIENKCVESLKEKLNEIQIKANSQYQKYENQISIFKNEIDEKLALVDNNVKEFEVSIKSETEDIKVSSYNHFNKQFADYHTGLDEKLRQYEKEMGQRLSQFDEAIEENKKDIFANLDSTKSDMQAWYAGFDQDMKASRDVLSEQNLKLREDVARLLEELKKEYAREKTELIDDSKKTRELYSQQLAEIAANIGFLNDELKEKSQTALEKMKNDSEIFLIDFMKKTRELEQEVDNKIKEFKTGVQEVRERIDSTEKKMMGRMSESARVLSITLDDIDKKQKNFIGQTKIFDRADSLKTILQEKIDDLKGDIIKVDAQSKDIKAAEKKFDSIRKLGDEVSSKLNRFLAEKRKIDEIEGDFKKLLNMSQAVDIKLDHITGVYDNLQEIDVKLRNFDTLFKDITEKFQRLEKKESIIETTTEGVDRNFQILQQMEKSLAGLSEITDMLPMRLNELENRFKKINLEKKDADKTMESLGKLTRVLGDVEERIEKMQQAREWIARTETRLTETGKKAEENIALLGTLIDKDNKNKKSQKGGAPSIDKREMVVKLAHQGWTSENIAQATGLSRGEVELILEIMPKK
ncbi:MAG: hypothetical protein H7A26_01050 [Spirochaetales bacterium]|nr:hypothetical protein [Spirochaetales bacterium]